MPSIAILSSVFYPFPAVGAVRVTNWARMLADEDHEVLVISKFQGHSASTERLEQYLGKKVDVRVFGVDGQELEAKERSPSKAWAPSWKRKIKGHLAELWIPDAEIRFWKSIYPRVQSLLREKECKAVITSSPKPSVLEAGEWLQRDLGIPWIADFRDPFLLDERMRPHGLALWTYPFRRRWLDRIYITADVVTHALPVQARWARSVYPARRNRFATLRHPVPTDLAGNLTTPIPSTTANRRVIAIVGFYDEEIASVLAKAISSLVQESSEQYDLEFRLIGTPPDELAPLETLLGDRLVIAGRVAHDVAKQHMAGADVLVNALSPQRSEYLGISSKLYEYAGARKPIITIRPTSCDRELLRHLPSEILDQLDVDQTTEALRRTLSQSPEDVARQLDPFIEKFSWKGHGTQLTNIIRSVNEGNDNFDVRE